jgi:hypothetical protein
VGLLDEALRRAQVVHLRVFHIVDQGPVQTHQQGPLQLETGIDQGFLKEFEGVVEYVVVHDQGPLMPPRLNLDAAQGRQRALGLVDLTHRIGLETDLPGLGDT